MRTSPWMATAIALIPGTLHAADHLNLEHGQPTTIEDAYTIKEGAIELQGHLGFERLPHNDKGRTRFTLAPRIEMGIAPNLQLSFDTPYRDGNAPETGQGDLNLEALYNFNTESLHVPAMSIGFGIHEPYGSESGGTETSLKAVATKSLGPYGDTYTPRRVHLNLRWNYNWDREPNERSNRYLMGVGYSQPINNEWVIVTDLYREEERMEGVARNIAEIGVRHQMTPLTVMTLGVNAGLNDQAPDWGVVIGFQHTLGSYP
jgi:hypothetical protein